MQEFKNAKICCPPYEIKQQLTNFCLQKLKKVSFLVLTRHHLSNNIVSSLGNAERKYSKKKRLIVDLSAPHNNENHPSINDLIDKNECSLSYVSIDDAIKCVIKFGKGALMCKTDISDAFKVIPILPSQYHLFCVKWRKLYYFYTRLAFGCRSSTNFLTSSLKLFAGLPKTTTGLSVFQISSMTSSQYSDRITQQNDGYSYLDIQ